MPRRFELLVFDWDGTLIDSAGAIAACIQAACRDLGLPVPDDERGEPRHRPRPRGRARVRGARRCRRPSTDAWSNATASTSWRAIRACRSFRARGRCWRTCASAGHVLAIATGKSRAGLARALEQTGLARLFDATRCADQCASKPAPEMLLELMDELDVDPARTLMIGDTVARPADGGERRRGGRGGELRRAPRAMRWPRSIRSRWSIRPRNSRRWLRGQRVVVCASGRARRRAATACASRWSEAGTPHPAFAIRYAGRVYAYRQPLRARRGGARLAAGAVFRCRWHRFDMLDAWRAVRSGDRGVPRRSVPRRRTRCRSPVEEIDGLVVLKARD